MKNSYIKPPYLCSVFIRTFRVRVYITCFISGFQSFDLSKFDVLSAEISESKRKNFMIKANRK